MAVGQVCPGSRVPLAMCPANRMPCMKIRLVLNIRPRWRHYPSKPPQENKGNSTSSLDAQLDDHTTFHSSVPVSASISLCKRPTS